MFTLEELRGVCINLIKWIFLCSFAIIVVVSIHGESKSPASDIAIALKICAFSAMIFNGIGIIQTENYKSIRALNWISIAMLVPLFVANLFEFLRMNSGLGLVNNIFHIITHNSYWISIIPMIFYFLIDIYIFTLFKGDEEKRKSALVYIIIVDLICTVPISITLILSFILVSVFPNQVDNIILFFHGALIMLTLAHAVAEEAAKLISSRPSGQPVLSHPLTATP